MILFKKRLIITFDDNTLDKVFNLLRENNIKFTAKMLSAWDMSLTDYHGVFDKAYTDGMDAPYEKDVRNLTRYSFYVSIFDYKKAAKLVEDAFGIEKRK
ncbi:MAG: hypothetical protein MJ244_06070 [Clostridia bacterium]|nr:hypothetical protein [Clostridia bacterium]